MASRGLRTTPSRPTTQEQAIDLEDRQTYLIVYPFSKTTEWYLMSKDARQGMMNEHMRIWIDNSDQAPEETVDEIVRGLGAGLTA